MTGYDGLHSEGLQPHPVAQWVGAKAPVSTVDANGNHQVEIVQENQNAFLYWNRFNVGSRTRLNFNQSRGGADAGKWIAFNKVMGSVAPSEIHGSITAQGQVYILNQNGIIFHSGSQVNTRGLVASSLPINPYFAGDPHEGIVGRGVINNEDYQFLFSALKLDTSSSYSDPWTPLDYTAYKSASDTPTPIGSASRIGEVVVQKGAVIKTPDSATKSGGRVMLVGSSVRNEGKISTPDGQTILAAGLQVGVQSHPEEDPSLRGLDVHIGRVVDAKDEEAKRSSSYDMSGNLVGRVVNNGIIETTRGHAAMAGREIRQNGLIDSTTSVTLNGRVDLLAAYNAVVPTKDKAQYRYFFDQNLPGGTTGTVDLGEGSVIRILPELSSDELFAGTRVSLSSIVSIMGNSINVGDNASILAPGANPPASELYYDMTKSARFIEPNPQQNAARILSGINLVAGNWLNPPGKKYSNFAGAATGVRPAGSISIARGAMVSAAGTTGTQVDSKQNFLTVELRGMELANSPLQRNGKVRGEKITLDARINGTINGRKWMGTPLGDATAFAGIIERSAGELTAPGGSIRMDAGESVRLDEGSVLDVSGGWISYTGGVFSTTKLLYQGQLVDISRAMPDRVYDGIFKGGGTIQKYDKWGVTKTFSMSPLDPSKGRREGSYIQGADGGRITIQAPSMLLDGTLRGEVVTGPRQIRDPDGLSRLPAASSLALRIRSFDFFGEGLLNKSPYAPTLIFTQGSIASGVFDQRRISLDASLFTPSQFGNLDVDNHDGRIEIPEQVALNTAPGGSVMLKGSLINLAGDIVSPGGTVSLEAYNLTYEEKFNYERDKDNLPTAAHFQGNKGRGEINVASSSTINVSGRHALHPDLIDRALPVVTDGGSISLAGYSVQLVPGSLLDVSAGSRFPGIVSRMGNPGFELMHGRAGSITISGGEDTEIRTLSDGRLLIGSAMRGFSGAGGAAGHLNISAPAIQIGGASSDPHILQLSPDFFNQGGFANFTLSGMGLPGSDGTAPTEIPGIRVVGGTRIEPMVRNRVFTPNGGYREFLKPEGMRPAVSLTLKARELQDPVEKTYLVRGKVVLERGSSVLLEPQLSLPEAFATAPNVTPGTLVIKGNLVELGGDLRVPGGSIKIDARTSYPEDPDIVPTTPQVTLKLSPGSVLSTAGTFVNIPDPLGYGRTLGSVLPGGSINLSGNIALTEKSLIDVSGTTGSHFVRAFLNTGETATGVRESLMVPKLMNRVESSGGNIALKGGQMLESLGSLLGRAGGASALGGTLSVSSGRFYNQNNGAEQTPDPRDVNLIITQDLLSLGARIVADRNAKISPKGYFAADSAAAGGFESLTLNGNVEFSGPVSITLPGSLRVASGGTIRADSHVNLKAGYAALGTPLVGARKTDDTTKNKAFGGDGDQYVPPSGGNGSLQVEARLIEIGNLLLANLSSASFLAPGGIIRGDGAVNIAGNLALYAAQIHPVTASQMSFFAYNPSGGKGSILVEQSGGPLSLPLSAGGTLSLYASTISQNGTLLSPFGTINLGWDGTGASPRDPVSGAGIRVGVSVPVTETLTLGSSGRTSISAIDPLSGAGVTIPYGIIVNDTQWRDPSGIDIASEGLPSKGVNLSALMVNTLGGSSIDLRGGGELAAFQWISGLKGTRDLAAPSSGSYAILPSFGSEFFPVANFADPSVTGKDPGYISESLAIGDRITLAGGAGLAAGTYTLLPARYALYPGGFLIKPTGLYQETRPASVQMPDGTARVAGIRYNDMRGGRSVQEPTKIYEITSPALLAQSADYRLIKGSETLPKAPSKNPVIDAGRLMIKSIGAMNLVGGIQCAGGAGGRGSSIDISSSKDFQIGGNAPAGTIALNAATLSSWNAGSLLIGGIRSITSTGISITPGTSRITVDNAGTPLTAADLILAAKDGIILKDNAAISSTGSDDASRIDIKGNGAVVRASTDRSASVTRTEYDKGSPVTGYEIGNGASINGGSVILESSGIGFISDSATLSADTYGIVAGSIAVGLDGTKRDGVLNLVGKTLEKLSLAKKVDLTSYGSLEFLGGGVLGSAATESISLNAGAILGTGMGDGIVSLNADTILLGNSAGSSRAPLGAKAQDGSSLTPSGTLELNARTIRIGENDLSLDRFSYVSLNASGVLAGSGKGGIYAGTAPMTYTTIAGDSLETLAQTYGVTTEMIADLNRDVLSGQDPQALPGGLAILISQTTDLFVTTPFVTGIQGAKTTITSSGGMRLMAPHPEYVTQSSVTPGLGSKLTLEGSTLSIDTSIMLPSGELTARATAGDLIIGTGGVATLNVGGISKTINSVTQFTDAGSMEFSSAGGDVIIGQNAAIMLNAAAKGSAGSLAILAPVLADTVSDRKAGQLVVNDRAVIQALAGSGGEGGALKLDLGELASISQLGFGRTDEGDVITLAEVGFTKSIDLRVRAGDLAVDNYLLNRNVVLTADNGSIMVTPDGVIDSSGRTGGSIALQASGSVILMPNAALTVHGDTYDNAGKGGSIFLSAGAAVERTAEDGTIYIDINRDAVLDLQTVSSIDLGVTAAPTRRDQFGGTLHLRAPITADNSDIQMGSLDSTITGASSIEVEGYRHYETDSSGDITETLRSTIAVNASTFFGSSEGNFDTATAIISRLTANQQSTINNLIHLAPGVEIINRTGNLTLNSDLDLSGFRTGKNNVPGFLSLRSAGDLVFNATLSDGFENATYSANLLQNNPLLSPNFQSWSYDFNAGNDFSSASLNALKKNTDGSIRIGKTSVTANVVNPNAKPGDALTSEAVDGYFQVLRTGTGNISLNASGSIRLMNQFATVYTAGSKDADQNLSGVFDVPGLADSSETLNNNPTILGRDQQPLNQEGVRSFKPAFSFSGGNIMLSAGKNIEHLQPDPDKPSGYVADSSRQLPINWLSRRGKTAENGLWDVIENDGKTEVSSSAWWVNFPSFFQGIGTLGGGNITMLAGGNVSNVDASLPTQGRMTGKNGDRRLTPGDSTLVETGGGDLQLRAGGSLDAGVYYTERGDGVIKASGDIISNPTRDVYGDYLHSIVTVDKVAGKSLRSPENLAKLTQALLPTSFFLGKGSLSITAGGDALLGPVGNVFLEPQGINNDLLYKTYFSTYDEKASFAATSLAGDITLRTKILKDPAFASWLSHSMLKTYADTGHPRPGEYQPWILIAEQDPLDTANSVLPLIGSLLPGRMNVSALSGDLSLQGDLTLSPSRDGGLSLVASGSIKGVSQQIPGESWSASVINVSDASPLSLPSVSSPRAPDSPVTPILQTDSAYLLSAGGALVESASFSGMNASLQSKQARHGLLNRDNTDPIRIIAKTGSLSGIELFAPKRAEIMVGGDIMDVAFAIQHLKPYDVSIISAGGEMRLYDANNPDLLDAIRDLKNRPPAYARPQPRSGDIQISGPGALQVIAGGNIDLGTGDARSDGTGVGISSIGNARNPSLPFEGASIITVAGAAMPGSLADAGLDPVALFTKVSAMADAKSYFLELKKVTKEGGDTSLIDKVDKMTSLRDMIQSSQITEDDKARLALSLFYIVLRESGRDYNDEDAPTYRSYKNGVDAIASLLTSKKQGDVIMNSRNFRTKSDGSISILAPGGGVSLASYNVNGAAAEGDAKLTAPPGIVTEAGGSINIFTSESVSLGIGRIFTLRGGDIMIWSDKGDIAAGASAKSVATAPPTRELIDPESGVVETELAGLATGGGIGVLATVKGVPPANVDLIAPTGVIDAGDAGIRATGNLNLAATRILNANNISVGGTTSGAPPAPPPPAAPNVSGATAASSASAGNNASAQAATKPPSDQPKDEAPSVISVEVLGYGGGDAPAEEESKKSAGGASMSPPQASL